MRKEVGMATTSLGALAPNSARVIILFQGAIAATPDKERLVIVDNARSLSLQNLSVFSGKVLDIITFPTRCV